MKIDAKIEIEYKNSKDANISLKSLDVENKGYVESEKEENILTFKLKSKSLSNFLATADDLIFSEILVEKIIESASSN
ncbi:MAG: KEOPS complex subunit Pcc1 [Methanobrevibacter sp.]|nr:KEOPS complex subunit Pcc1 [Methanobrevibacter sp.]MEA4956283.1 KEOPS complex subunit Pcc1 [Methanobrevibacter sp.]